MKQICPQCGGPGLLLFNLMACTTINCRNYDELWAKDWLKNFGPIFTHNQFPGSSNHIFLGRFVIPQGTKFDIYTCKVVSTGNMLAAAFAHVLGNGVPAQPPGRPRAPAPVAPSHVDICIARFGNNTEQAYYVDAGETEIGIPGNGPVASVSDSVKEALKHAVVLFKKRRKFLSP